MSAPAPGIDVRIAEIIQETPDIRLLRLAKLDGAPFSAFIAGAHIDVTGPTGTLRQYSLTGDPRDPGSILIAVKREAESRGGSAALHEVEVGDLLRIGVPRNLLTIAEGADQHVLVAGGIGVTPLLAMAYELSATDEDFQLHYFVRSREQAAFVDLLENRVAFGDRVHLHVGVPRSEQPAVYAEIAAGLTPASHVYTCGPQPFMDAVSAAVVGVVGADRVHIEHFVADEIDTTGDTGFVVELDTGEVFDVPADSSILDVLEQNGIEVFKSCEEGICGSCVSGLLEGVVDHRDQCLTSTDRANQIAVCVSRAISDRLVIELY